LSPCTTDRGVAEQWLNGYAGTDGVIAKRLDAAYVPGDRAAMRKIKRMRTADCVVGGFRYATTGNQVGSLLLGLFDDDGLLHHCGFTSSFTAAERVSVTRVVERYANGAGFSGRVPEAHSRWIGERSARWVPVRPELVCEVRYDHFSDGRFRHGTKLLRWRPDKGPRECTFDQVRPKRVRRGKTSRKSTGATAA
jgi:ATP-dependent DNA ligase